MQYRFRLGAIARHHQQLRQPVGLDPVEVDADVGRITEVGVRLDDLASQRGVARHEGLPDAAAVGVVEVQHGGAGEFEPFVNPSGERRAVLEVGGAEPEDVPAPPARFRARWKKE